MNLDELEKFSEFQEKYSKMLLMALRKMPKLKVIFTNSKTCMIIGLWRAVKDVSPIICYKTFLKT